MIISICLMVIMVVSLLLLVKISGLESGERKVDNFLFSLVVDLALIATVCLIGGLIGASSGDFQRDTTSYDVVIEDKWKENSIFYFADTEGNVYRITERWSFEFRNNKSLYESLLVQTKYEMVPSIRYKNMVIGERYMVEVFCGLSGMRCIKEELYYKNERGG